MDADVGEIMKLLAVKVELGAVFRVNSTYGGVEMQSCVSRLTFDFTVAKSFHCRFPTMYLIHPHSCHSST
jgi:hypothetical protein